MKTKNGEIKIKKGEKKCEKNGEILYYKYMESQKFLNIIRNKQEPQFSHKWKPNLQSILVFQEVSAFSHFKIKINH